MTRHQHNQQRAFYTIGEDYPEDATSQPFQGGGAGVIFVLLHEMGWVDPFRNLGVQMHPRS
jgi:hypothetical protein